MTAGCVPLDSFSLGATAVGVDECLTSLGAATADFVSFVFVCAGVDALDPGVVLAGVTPVPFRGSGSSSSSAERHPNWSRNLLNPDRFFFFGPAVVGFLDVCVVFGRDDEEAAAAAGVVVVVFFSEGFLSEVLLLPESLRVKLSIGRVPVPLAPAGLLLLAPTASFSPALSPGTGRGWSTLLDACRGVDGVAGVKTISGGVCRWASPCVGGVGEGLEVEAEVVVSSRVLIAAGTAIARLVHGGMGRDGKDAMLWQVVDVVLFRSTGFRARVQARSVLL